MAGSTVSNISIAVSANATPAIAGLKKVQREVMNVGKTANKSRNSVKAFGVELQGKGGANKKVRSVLQQTGYQFGDFAVQVGGGTSAMQAFGQQAPQLLQVFGPMGSIIGAGVAIFAAIAVAIQKTGAAAEEAAGKAKTLEDALSNSQSSLSDFKNAMAMTLPSSFDDLVEKFGAISDGINFMVQASADLQRSKLISSIADQSRLLAASLGELSPAVDGYVADLARLKLEAKELAEDRALAWRSIQGPLGFKIELPFMGMEAGANDLKKFNQMIGKATDPAVARFVVLKDSISKVTIALAEARASGNGLIDITDILNEMDGDLKKGILSSLPGFTEKLAEIASGLTTEGIKEPLLDLVAVLAQASAVLNMVDSNHDLAQSIKDAAEFAKEYQEVTSKSTGLFAQVDMARRLNELLKKGVSYEDAKEKAAKEILDHQGAAAANLARELTKLKAITAELTKQGELKGDAEELFGPAPAKDLSAAIAAKAKANALVRSANGFLAKGMSPGAAKSAAARAALEVTATLSTQAGFLARLNIEGIKLAEANEKWTKSAKKSAKSTKTFADTLKDAQNEALILGETLSIMKSEGVTSEIASEMAKAAIAFKTTKEQAAALQSVLSETAKTAAAIRLAAAPGLARQEFASGEAERGQSTNAAVKEFGLLMGGMGPDTAAALGALQAEWEAVGLSVTDVTANTEKFIKSTEKLSQAKSQVEMFKAVADTFNNSFATAFDSIVTGAKSVKDAFRDMGRDILRTISRLLMSSAMQSLTKMLSGGKSGGGGGPFGLITGVLSSLLGGGAASSATADAGAASWLQPNAPIRNAKGNAFSGGSIIPFANGGIVSRATMFPMNNGIGQMAESGPEAIIPLSRGSDGKLGVSGGGTTVNQTINVTTGIQQTVRAEIQSLMPQIAAASTKAVLDARRRGGSFAGAFG